MFKRKKPCLCVRLAGVMDTPLYDGPVAELAVPERVVLALSEKFFGDPEPCHIHRGAVLSRVYSELHQASGDGNGVSIASLPEEMRGCLCAYPGAEWISFYKAEPT